MKESTQTTIYGKPVTVTAKCGTPRADLIGPTKHRLKMAVQAAADMLDDPQWPAGWVRVTARGNQPSTEDNPFTAPPHERLDHHTRRMDAIETTAAQQRNQLSNMQDWQDELSTTLPALQRRVDGLADDIADSMSRLGALESGERREASMRPTPEGVGNGKLPDKVVARVKSFNEAHARRRGKLSQLALQHLVVVGFNEAHARRRGKFVNQAETQTGGVGFNEAHARRRGKLPGLRRAWPGRCCFNEAHARRRGKYAASPR